MIPIILSVPNPAFAGNVVVIPVITETPLILFWMMLVIMPTQTEIAEFTLAHDP